VNEWLVVLLAGLGSYVLRMSMIMTDRFRLPARLEASVEMVAPAAFAALAASALATAVVSATTALAATPVIVAGIVAVALAARTGRPYTSLLGLPAYWLTAAVLGAL
jgi:branched-subunit amino acid transport protein